MNGSPRSGPPDEAIRSSPVAEGTDAGKTRPKEPTVQTVPTIQYANDETPYRAGACNIGPAEQARRRRAGIAGIAAAATLAVLMVVAGAEPILRWVVAIPLYGGIIGFAQAQLKFCVGFGLSGVRNFGALGSVDKVEAEAVAADRRRAILVGAACGVATIAITAVFVALPI